MNLPWKWSYETLKFDTVDGDLHKGQYAIDENGNYLIRIHPENNNQWIVLDPFEVKDINNRIAGLTKVNILPGEHMYYDEFILPGGRIYRTVASKTQYRNLAKIGASGRAKALTAQQIVDVQKDDALWQ